MVLNVQNCLGKPLSELILSIDHKRKLTTGVSQPSVGMPYISSQNFKVTIFCSDFIHMIKM